jgi:hypothetical protein
MEMKQMLIAGVIVRPVVLISDATIAATVPLRRIVKETHVLL